MFVTIWMCTQEWSLISIRVTAFTFATCHQRLQLVVAVHAPDHAAELLVAADGHVDPHPLDRLGGRQPRLALGLRRDRRSRSPRRSRLDRPRRSPRRGAYARASGFRAVCLRPMCHTIRHERARTRSGSAVHDDLHRWRLTVFFRLILAIPHIVWFVVWSIVTLFVAIVGWIWALVTGQLPGRAAPVLLRLHPLRHALLRLPLPRHRAVPAVQRPAARRLSGRRRRSPTPAAAAAAARARPDRRSRSRR